MRVQVVLFAVILAVAELAPLEEDELVPHELVIPEYETAGPSTGLFIDDMQVDPHRNALRSRASRWKDGIVPYSIYSSYPQNVKDLIIAAFREIEHDVNGPDGTCIKFVPRTTEQLSIQVLPQDGCHSNVGVYTKVQPQPVSIGKGCEYKGVIMHELLHALGFFHEQNRYDRDNYIDIDYTNIKAGSAVNFRKHPSSLLDTLGVKYDFLSIMHYGPYTFAADKSKPVIKPKPGLDKGHTLGQRLELSSSDVLKIQKYYNCKEDTSHITAFKTDRYVVHCNFANGLCNLDTSGSPVPWIATAKDDANAGPHAGNTNGIDKYLLVTASGHRGKVAQIKLPDSKGNVCLDFYAFQKGPTSYVDVIATGSYIRTQTIKTYRDQVFNRNMWIHHRVSITSSSNYPVNFVIRAHLNDGDIAIDDLNLYSGSC